jgi:hypothetical protein
MSINLPPIINQIAGVVEDYLRPIANQVSDPIQLNNLSQNRQLNKRFVICLSKDLSEDEVALLQYYGRTISYDHDIVNNIDLSTVDFSYFLLDLREATNRDYLQKIILPNVDKFHLILYKYSFQDDNGISFEVERSELPKKQVNSDIFNKLLLQPEIKSPNCILSLLKSIVCKGNVRK